MVKQIEPTGSYMISRAAGCRAMGRTERVNQRRLRGRMYLKNDFPHSGRASLQRSGPVKGHTVLAQAFGPSVSIGTPPLQRFVTHRSDTRKAAWATRKTMLATCLPAGHAPAVFRAGIQSRASRKHPRSAHSVAPYSATPNPASIASPLSRPDPISSPSRRRIGRTGQCCLRRDTNKAF